MKVDDMKVSDFLYILDSMQEECCQHKRCDGCRYNDFCDDIDLPSIDSVSLRKTIEGYAESNGLLDHMQYVKNHKWISVNEMLPKEFEFVLVCLHNRVMTVASRTTNGTFYNIQGDEIWPPIAWMPLPEPYTPYKGEHNEKH